MIVRQIGTGIDEWLTIRSSTVRALAANVSHNRHVSRDMNGELVGTRGRSRTCVLWVQSPTGMPATHGSCIWIRRQESDLRGLRS
jgi:hypothetical protein